MSGTSAAPTYDQVPHKRMVGYIQVYTFFFFFGDKLNSVWSGMCLRKRPTPQSVSRNKWHCFRTCKGFVHCLSQRTFFPFAGSGTLGKSASSLCLQTRGAALAGPCFLFSYSKETCSALWEWQEVGRGAGQSIGGHPTLLSPALGRWWFQCSLSSLRRCWPKLWVAHGAWWPKP